jgi:predicted DNA-binding transcriptional regulator YafY
MAYPTSRMLVMLEVLQARSHVGGRDLARLLEVDARTIRRYAVRLQDLGIPVESTRGPHGAYRLAPGFKLPPLMLTDAEGLAVVLGLLIARRMGLSDAVLATESALAKFTRVAPADLRARVQAVRETLVLESLPPDTATTSDLVLRLSVATQHHASVRLRYCAFDGAITERVVDPYAVVHRAGRWYLAGWCHLRRDVRVFRLDRMQQAEDLAATFTPPEAFDALTVVERAIASTPGTWETVILLDATLEDARQMISPAFAMLDPIENGVLMRCFTTDLAWMARQLAHLPFNFTIQQPPELRDAVRELGERLMGIAGAS